MHFVVLPYHSNFFVGFCSDENDFWRIFDYFGENFWKFTKCKQWWNSRGQQLCISINWGGEYREFFYFYGLQGFQSNLYFQLPLNWLVIWRISKKATKTFPISTTHHRSFRSGSGNYFKIENENMKKKFFPKTITL
jgi:hypothetical protein